MSKTEIPSIRFHGFDDAWEQRKLSELIIEYKRNRNEFILSNKIIFYQIKNSKNLVRLLKLFNCNFNTLLEFETFLFIVAIVHL